MLEGVTLAGMVEFMVQVLVDLSGSTVLDEQATEDTLAAHPQNLRRHTRVFGTLPLTVARVATGAAGICESPGSRARVHRVRLLDNEPIRHQLANGLAWSSSVR